MFVFFADFMRYSFFFCYYKISLKQHSKLNQYEYFMSEQQMFNKVRKLLFSIFFSVQAFWVICY